MNHLNKKKILQSYTFFQEHDPFIRSMLVGHMLGDGYARRDPIKNSLNRYNTRLEFCLGGSNLDYAKYIHTTFSSKGYCNPKDLILKKNFDSRTNKDYFYVAFKTYNLKSLNDLHSMFYRLPTEDEIALYLQKTGKKLHFIKVIPANIEDLLTPHAFAIWIMDDGHFMKTNGALRIATHAFTYEEVLLLQQALVKTFNLQSNIHHTASKTTKLQQYLLYFPKSQTQKIIALVKPYFVPSMLYKLGLNEENKDQE